MEIARQGKPERTLNCVTIDSRFIGNEVGPLTIEFRYKE